ncbi:MAG: hypothetical protein JNN08_27060 [Bryobacterales bacterium]|nr:hypothetical protein [Bryobacterales bacterium]
MPATIPVTVTIEEQAALLAQANAEGVSVDTLVRRAVLQLISPTEAGKPQVELSGEELEQAFEELADLVSESVPPVPAESLRRENMYSREDEW